MKRTNRIISILLAVVMVVCMIPILVFATDAVTIDRDCGGG